MLGNGLFISTPKMKDVSISAIALSSGMYFARIESDNGSKTIKLIKK